MNPIPNTDANELGQRISKLFSDTCKSNQMTDEIGWQRHMEDVKKLKVIHEFAAQAYANEGVLFALKANREKSFTAFKKAMRLAPSDKSTLLNYIICAIMLGKSKSVAKDITAVSELIDGNPEDISFLFNCSVRCCMFKTAEMLLSKLEKLNKTELISKSLFSNTCEAFTFLNKHQFNEQDIIERLDVADDIVFSIVKKPIVNRGLINTHAGLIYEFSLSLPVDKLVEIDWAIADALTEKFDNPMANLISFSTTTFTPQNHRVYANNT